MKMWVLVLDSAREVFGHIESVKILVILNLTGYMLTSSIFSLFFRGIFFIDSPKTITNSPEVSDSNRGLFFTLNCRFIFVTKPPILSEPRLEGT